MKSNVANRTNHPPDDHPLAMASRNAAAAHAESGLADAELAAILEAAQTGPVNPGALSEARERQELASIAADRADADLRHVDAIHRDEQQRALLDSVLPTIETEDVEVWAALQNVRSTVGVLGDV